MRSPGSDSGEPRQLFDDTSAGQHNSGPGSMDKGGMDYAGHAILSDPMSNLAMAYGSSLASQGKQMMDKNVRALCSNLLLCPEVNAPMWSKRCYLKSPGRVAFLYLS